MVLEQYTDVRLRVLEDYLESQKLYELFESLMKSLITKRPADPIEHLINKLE